MTTPQAFVLCFALATATCHPAELFAQPPGPGFGGPGFGRQQGSREKIEPDKLPFEMGVASVPDRETFEKLSYQGPVRMDTYLSGIEFVKFIIENAMTDNAKTYWMNTQNYQAHPQFMGAIGMQGGPGGGRGRGGFGGPGGGPGGGGPGGGNGTRMMRGAVCYMPRLRSPNGTVGLYIFDFQPNDQYSFEEIKFARDTILKTMPFVAGKLAFHPLPGNVRLYESEKDKYANSDVAVYLDSDLYGDIAFLPMNPGESFGRLVVMEGTSLPSQRDIVICRTLPNQMPRVAGVITEVRQTPLSHVNLRAVQDKVPNAYVSNALQADDVKSLLGKYVRYEVNSQGYKIREASQQEVDTWFTALRPTEPQLLKRDLEKKEILPLSKIQFQDSSAFGVKTTNIATMLSFGFPEGTVPNGAAVPFYFYDEFMKHNGFYEKVAEVLKSESFSQNRETQEAELKKVREMIEGGMMPDWMMMAISDIQKTFPEGTPIRCRSSTNNEDLPGFSGAGLYDSFTHRPDEGHLSSSIKQVYASLWNFRAFEEREFYRVDHMQVAMGVLLHPNYSDELANGVAVTDDVLYETDGNYYVNAQVGEDLVTNPDQDSSPEEVLLGWWKEDGQQVVRKAADGKPILSQNHLEDLRKYMAKIHGRFQKLYGKSDTDKFAMEIEFKITKDGKVAIKQARPWVF
ncbi:MAG: PEP/pyruvate-binding domain-containing protein [Planctomycetaceae bacterium]